MSQMQPFSPYTGVWERARYYIRAALLYSYPAHIATEITLDFVIPIAEVLVQLAHPDWDKDAQTDLATDIACELL